VYYNASLKMIIIQKSKIFYLIKPVFNNKKKLFKFSKYIRQLIMN